MADRALVLFANRSGYELMPDNDQYKNRFEIKSESGPRKYTIAQKKTSLEWSCSCVGWKMKKPGRERGCKHLNAMMPTLRCIGVQPKQPTPVRRIAR